MWGSMERTPRSLLVAERSDPERVRRLIRKLHLPHKVSLLVPGWSATPPHLDTLLNTWRHFVLVRKLPLFELLDPDFLENAVFKGSTSCLSYRTRIDEDNCFALLPNGVLILSLDKDSYETLGVEGSPSKFSCKPCRRYVVSVDLKDRKWSPGGRSYQRLLTGLRERTKLESDFLLAHDPGEMATLHFLSHYAWTEHRPQTASRVLRDLVCPALLTSDLLTSDPHSFLEWLGAVEAGVPCSQQSSFLSSFSCPEPRVEVGGALCCSVSGLLHPDDVLTLLDQLRRCLAETPATPWLALSVHGFVDSPVSWGRAEHGVLTGGDHFCCLLLFQDGEQRILMGTGAQDACPP